MSIDDKLTDLPPSVEEALGPGYLGSPKVVEDLLRGYISEVMDWVQRRGMGVMSAEQMTNLIKERSEDFATIFAGENPGYTPIRGWNSRTLGLSQYLKSDLGHYWQSNRADFGDDPLRVFYMWLVWGVTDAMNAGDDSITAAKMGSRISQAIRFLTGSVKRK